TADGGVDTSTPPKTFTIQVGRVAKNTVTSSHRLAVVGQPFTLTATVAPIGKGPVPTGTVTFRDGTTELGTVPVLPSGRAKLALLTAVTRRTHPITAVYSGDSVYLTRTSRVLNEVVRQAKTRTRLTTSAPVVTQGDPVTFTATVSARAPGKGIPTGNVHFVIN